MLRFLQEHEPFRKVMRRVNRVLMAGSSDRRSRVVAAMAPATIAGTVIHPLVERLDEATLRRELLEQRPRARPGGLIAGHAARDSSVPVTLPIGYSRVWRRIARTHDEEESHVGWQRGE